jgi:hypothetical protein
VKQKNKKSETYGFGQRWRKKKSPPQTWLKKLDWHTVDLDKTTSLGAESYSGGGFLFAKYLN